jgi:hypothetical protein
MKSHMQTSNGDCGAAKLRWAGDAQRSVSLGGIRIWIRTKTLWIRNTDSRCTVLVQNWVRYFGLISSLHYSMINTGNANLTRIHKIR